MAPNRYAYNMPPVLSIDFLMPNNILINIDQCHTNTRLDIIKDELYPFYHLLQSPNDYIFVCRTLKGEEEIYDESRNISDIQLYIPILKLVEPEGNREEKKLTQDISTAIGRALSELDEVKDRDQEVLDARCALYTHAEQVTIDRRVDNVDQYGLPADCVCNLRAIPALPADLTLNCTIDIWVQSSQPTGSTRACSSPYPPAGDGDDATVTYAYSNPITTVSQSPSVHPLDASPPTTPTSATRKERRSRPRLPTLTRREEKKESASSTPRTDDTGKEKGQKVTMHCNLLTTSPEQLTANLITVMMEDTDNKNYLKQYGESFANVFLLKVAGFQLYLLADVPLIRFKHISERARQRLPIILMLMDRKLVYERMHCSIEWRLQPPAYLKRQQWKRDELARSKAMRQPSLTNVRSATLPASSAQHGEEAGRPSNARNSWAVEQFFRLRIISAGYINISEVDEIYVKVGLFHGPHMIATQDTTRKAPNNPRWDEMIFLDSYIPDLPRATQICLSLCSVRKRKGSKTDNDEEHCALAWVNTRLFDRDDRMIDSRIYLNMWPFARNFDGFVNPLGHNGPNPDWESSRLDVEFEPFETDVVYPSDAIIGEYVQLMKKRKRKEVDCEPPKALESITADDRKFVVDSIRTNTARELGTAQKDRLWELRLYCQQVPDSLPRLLDSLKWHTRVHVAQMYSQLKTWPHVSADTALELLSNKYPDRVVRRFAVKCLDYHLDDDQLTLYMMMIIQVLRYEAFLDNDLNRFLLRRALTNKGIGHMLFWLLRSELAIAPIGVTIRFTLILEAYCRGCGPYLHSLIAQTLATDALERLTRQIRDNPKCEWMAELRNKIDLLENLESPLDSSHWLGALEVRSCRCLTSAKRPLWLVWSNPDPLADTVDATHEIIFKNGDDLRQDMLTLQVMRVMDSIWKTEGHDYLLNLYSCLPMGKHIGMIEVVKQSRTFGEIGVVSRSTLINNWIRSHNQSDELYAAAVERFTSSCVGYTVATFVLGIRDRHADNVMVTEDGRIFHIDFGHFLDHYKKKLGINRDRVPFLLTDEIMTVLAHGSDDPFNTKYFERFKIECREAFIILHRHAHLFITLFTMMLCMGIPELQRQEDINFLRRTLAADKTEQEAVNYFDQQLELAHKRQWTTQVNNFAHQIHIKMKNAW